MSSCLKCGGDGKMANGSLCPECSKLIVKKTPIVQGIPVQYQGVKFDKKFLPEKEQKEYGTFMEDLLTTIVNDLSFYQKNLCICSRANSGKTVWAYSLIALLSAKGYTIPNLRDITEVRNILNSYDNKEEAALWSSARCAIIKLPRDMQPWMFDVMSYVVERRVRSDGFTIFLYGGTLDDLKFIDKYNRLPNMLGTGSYNTIKVESF